MAANSSLKACASPLGGTDGGGGNGGGSSGVATPGSQPHLAWETRSFALALVRPWGVVECPTEALKPNESHNYCPVLVKSYLWYRAAQTPDLKQARLCER